MLLPHTPETRLDRGNQKTTASHPDPLTRRIDRGCAANHADFWSRLPRSGQGKLPLSEGGVHGLIGPFVSAPNHLQRFLNGPTFPNRSMTWKVHTALRAQRSPSSTWYSTRLASSGAPPPRMATSHFGAPHWPECLQPRNDSISYTVCVFRCSAAAWIAAVGCTRIDPSCTVGISIHCHKGREGESDVDEMRFCQGWLLHRLVAVAR